MKDKKRIKALEDQVRILTILWWMHIIGSIITHLIAIARYL